MATIEAGAAAPENGDSGRALERALIGAILLVEVAWVGGLLLLLARLL